MALVPQEILRAFRDRFGPDENPVIYRAPGRVNLIGEHTDYNLGFVFPIALEMACYVASSPAPDNQLHIFSRDREEEVTVEISSLQTIVPRQHWSDYVLGVARELLQLGIQIKPARLWIESEVPVGSGLSSSAALEVSSALALLGEHTLPPLELARLAQRAENRFVGMPCGIMDQYASVFGRNHQAVQIDCRDLSCRYTRLPENVAIIAVNSLVKHDLGTSAYRERVAECAQAVAVIAKTHPQVHSLRDVTPELFERVADKIPPLPRKRARHVITDSQRVLDLAAAAEADDLPAMGKLFVQSHRSMQYDYEISCEEIDFLVDRASVIPGVYGSRMTGGGFGGCTVNLVAPDCLKNFQLELGAAYQERYGLYPIFYQCVPAAGAGKLAVD